MLKRARAFSKGLSLLFHFISTLGRAKIKSGIFLNDFFLSKTSCNIKKTALHFKSVKQTLAVQYELFSIFNLLNLPITLKYATFSAIQKCRHNICLHYFLFIVKQQRHLEHRKHFKLRSFRWYLGLL